MRCVTPTLTIAFVVLALAAGCTPPSTSDLPATPPTPASPAAPDENRTPAYRYGASRGDPCLNPVPTVMTPATPEDPSTGWRAVSRCLWSTQIVPGDGEWSVQIVQQATTGLGVLVAALALPSEAVPRPDTACGTSFPPVWLTVTDASGKQFQPDLPSGPWCGRYPRDEVIEAIDSLPWATVDTIKVRQSRPEAAVASGCDMRSWSLPGWELLFKLSWDYHTAEHVSVCRYTPYATDPHMGEFEGALNLDATQTSILLAALEAAPPADTCGVEATAPFALVSSGGVPMAVVELDGCHRAFVGLDNTLRQLDAAIVAPLLG